MVGYNPDRNRANSMCVRRASIARMSASAALLLLGDLVDELLCRFVAVLQEIQQATGMPFGWRLSCLLMPTLSADDLRSKKTIYLR